MSSSEVKNVLDLLTHGVYIIGVKYGSKINGMTAAWVNQVSSQPPMSPLQ
jgi:flavin reductase (DIM6/NTAB) family NADH-FMN oxidoreductase RutF